MNRLGLTHHQAKIYFCLVGKEPSSTKTIAHLTAINRGNVYTTLNELHDLGLIEKIVCNPAKYRAVPIDDAVSILVADKTRQFTEMQSLAEELVSQTKINSNERECNADENELILVPARHLLALGEKIFNETMHSIEVVASYEKFHGWITHYPDPNLEALKKGVKMRVLLSETEPSYTISEAMNALTSEPNFKLQYTPTMPKSHFSIYDSKTVFCSTSTSNELTDSPSYLLKNPCIVSAFNELFELLWSTTKKQTP